MEKMDWLFLYAQASVFIFVFMEIVVTIAPFKRVLSRQAAWYDKIFLIALFGGFSVFGTYIGVTMPSGAIMSVRDLGPMIAGITAGPVVGLGAGLIGGIHRYYLGGEAALPCSLATVFSGLICGAILYFRGGRIVGVFRGVAIAALVECFHMVLVLLLLRPFDAALELVRSVAIPMIVANSLGMFFTMKLIVRDDDHARGPENAQA